MVRTICKAEKEQITLPIPKDYIGTTVEILVFPIPVEEQEPKPVFGCAKGQFWMADDFDAPLDCFLTATAIFEGMKFITCDENIRPYTIGKQQ